MVETGEAPDAIVERKGLRQVSDTGAIEQAVDAALAANPAQVAQYRTNPKVLGFFVGQVMKATGGQGQPGAGQRTAAPEAGRIGPRRRQRR